MNRLDVRLLVLCTLVGALLGLSVPTLLLATELYRMQEFDIGILEGPQFILWPLRGAALFLVMALIHHATNARH